MVRAKKEQVEILVPKGVAERIERKDATCLMWWIIDWWNQDDWGWCRIHDKHFNKITTDDETRTGARTYMREKRYLDTKPPVEGKLSTRYRLREHNDPMVPYSVTKEKQDRCWPFDTQDEEACWLTRKNLDLLERIPGKVQKELADDEGGQRFDRYMIKTLEKKKGNVHRGFDDDNKAIGRIFSPWANSSKRIRPLFTLAGEKMVCLDMRASQVAFLAARYEDKKLLLDCKEDLFYGGLFAFLKDKDIFRGFKPKKWKKGDPIFKPTDRNSIKEPFFAWYFGDNVSTHSFKFRKAIDNWMNANYPITADGVRSEKQGDYAKLARNLQLKEAKIFVDGIYCHLDRLGVPALLIHDAVFVGESNKTLAKSVIEEHLANVPGLTQYHLKEEPNDFKL
jgi:hypothetical protein